MTIALPSGKLAERYQVALACELQLDAVVDEALARESLPGAGLDQQVDDALLKDACADARLDVLATWVFEDHRLDALVVEEMAEQ